MKTLRRICLAVLFAATSFSALAQSTSAAAGPEIRDGQHDWDQLFGNWKMHLRRRLNPLTGSNQWVDFEAHDVFRGVLAGRANLDEFEAEGATGHIEGLTLRMYDPTNHYWRIYWANAAGPTMDGPPMVGRYTNGRGEFYDHEIWHGKSIYVRFLWTNVSDHSGDFEQSFSEDGGKNWEPNWNTTMEREEVPGAKVAPNPDIHDGQHDFDFEFGTWHGHLKRLLKPLSGSSEWKEYDGGFTVGKLWNGRANIAELQMTNGGTKIEGVSLRLFDPKTRQWTLWWANLHDGVLDEKPLAGCFQNGRGEFFGQTVLDGKWVMVRFEFSGLSDTAEHVEQAFSTDGKTWETNWTGDFTKEKKGQ
ncbi:hypothetical protein Acid345_2173 [Candidatus Koribacter versatilis Ellin345]|uniref:DUF1579 domain-containing protein n=1 Tax=Koribacter versatilis (strain Ellin345) TaxID=204669 RepID=Q1IPM6_KORVE|nr:hypothetical protein [Candidatus Koribacter versatilis]ABF41174.1 hypothetical protein Acid345_2173 [Candidatus Koribacter versatilis Ellin345]